MALITLNDFWLGCFASFIASFVLVLLIFIFAKPKFKIAKKIAYLDTNEFGSDLEGSYLIKVGNKSFFSAYDLSANLERMETYHVENGTNNRSFDLTLVDSTTNFLSGRSLLKNSGKSAFLFRTTEDLKEALQKRDSKLRFTLMARNGFSGLTKMFTIEL